ncbi:MAG: hypothetical protein WCY97_03725 [Methanothrix sp.]|jgi:hypothetical protein|uniref:Uncharacterized protein n=1 Tax=Methanothrix harundinacea TaxID=301375 RepID=A0A101FUW4_9EURY|nr:MAG: hypothetical protein APR56_06775 [Methanosaeta sp. SDB]KUK44792.1 MAG: Uncharacterized protein XD72_0827 [Methanothrix harundinacea]MDD3709312.1 hypothetical protein [Methanothrix sp.]MDI9399422.1 hypothetical protein [Euryarchaeota archaeon]KUK96845.1 MAG: Uncharacterized protein XE07_0796 [Methanothrix harundinacea]
MENNCRLIGLVLMSTLLIFVPACDVASAGPLPTAAERSYPESLNMVKSSLEDFAKGGSSAKAGIFSPGDLKRSTKFDSSLSDLTGVSLFDDPDDEETFQGVVAINTERGNTVTGQGQFKTVPTDVNYMDIDVRNIIVISINTARGGNAIATSEIFIEPIQKAS